MSTFEYQGSFVFLYFHINGRRERRERVLSMGLYISPECDLLSAGIRVNNTGWIPWNIRGNQSEEHGVDSLEYPRESE